MGESLIYTPQPGDIPPDLQPAKPAGLLVPMLPCINPDDVPRTLGWKVAVLPVVPPESTAGGLALALDSLANLELTRSVGQVVGIGPLAFSAERKYPESCRESVTLGQWVLFHLHAGQDVQIRTADGRGVAKLKYLNEADLLAVCDTPEQVQALLVVR
jgi:co-chaperonin GroES (HSP10)